MSGQLARFLLTRGAGINITADGVCQIMNNYGSMKTEYKINGYYASIPVDVHMIN